MVCKEKEENPAKQRDRHVFLSPQSTSPRPLNCLRRIQAGEDWGMQMKCDSWPVWTERKAEALSQLADDRA